MTSYGAERTPQKGVPESASLEVCLYLFWGVSKSRPFHFVEEERKRNPHKMKTKLLLLTLAITARFTFTLHAQSDPPPPPPSCDTCTNYSESPITNSPGRSIIDLDVRYIGTLRLELFDRDKPASVKNFLQYIFSNDYTK